MIYQNVGRNQPIIQMALEALNYLLGAVGICLLLSGVCCGVGSMASDRTHHRWLRLTMFFFACSLIIMAAVIAITVTFRLWYTKVIG